MNPTSWRVLWSTLLLLIVLCEGIALGRPETGDTLTEYMRFLRFDPVARFIVVPVAVWLAWHWFLRPQGIPEFTWRDVVALILGVGVAILDSLRHS